MEHEANGLVLIFLGEAPACRQDGSLRLLSAAALTDCLQDRERSTQDYYQTRTDEQGTAPGAGPPVISYGLL
jgi:hypothetical protein